MTIKPCETESIDYCIRDYKHHHSWARVGIERGMIIYQCSQCRKCAFEEIIMIGNLFPSQEGKEEK